VISQRPSEAFVVEHIVVRGVVQGVGFRPTVARVARALGLTGSVRNDGTGVHIEVAAAAPEHIDMFIAELKRGCPPLASIESIERERVSSQRELRGAFVRAAFVIDHSQASALHTTLAPDAATCDACLAEVRDPFARRFRYPFTNCTHCGPRLSIALSLPYDRERTSMRGFQMCAACAAEYADEHDRRYHAQPIACHACGPKAHLLRADGKPVEPTLYSMLDAVDAVCTLLRRGAIIAIKGLGAYHLACDATLQDSVLRLRERKRRPHKPLALMARDMDVLRRFAQPTAAEERALHSPAHPIVLIRRADPSSGRPVAEAVASDQAQLGFMLPYTPLHHLMLARNDRPIVLTSANPSGEPPIIDDAQALHELADVAEFFLVHDRPIAHRVDDSVVRVFGQTPTVLRRARGYAPKPMRLPEASAQAPAVLAAGADGKASFCMCEHGEAVLSEHVGDLESVRAQRAYGDAYALHVASRTHVPVAVAVDSHPDSHAARLAQSLAPEGCEVLVVAHHHAHVASCMVDNGVAADERVLGIVLDGLGVGEASELWGGEFLLSDYKHATRVGTCKPVALLGGDAAAREPWRALYAHLMAEIGWADLEMNYGELPVLQYLASKPRTTLDAMLKNGIHAPRASSAGRLFDAVAAALDLHRERITFEGQAAMALESSVDMRALAEEDELLAYPFTVPLSPPSAVATNSEPSSALAASAAPLPAAGRDGGLAAVSGMHTPRLPYIEPLAMWRALLGDLVLDTPKGVIAARFHRGFGRVVAQLGERLAREHAITKVALTGGVFQNAILLDQVQTRLSRSGLTVLTHRDVPPNDGGIALGQAAIATARLSARRQAPCV